MNEQGGRPSVTPEQAREALSRIAASQAFHGADTLRRLLQYLGEAELEGRGDQIKEYTVGIEALGRSPDYDPRSDSTARMQASRLRARLEEYYRGEGTADPVRVSLPKGGFRMVFSTRHEESGPAGRIWRWVALGLALASLSLSALLWQARVRPEPVERARWTPDLETLWAPFLDNDVPILMSYGNPLFVSLGRWSLRRSDLNEWTDVEDSAEFAGLAKALGLAAPKANWDYVGAGDVNGAFRIARQLAGRKRELNLKRGSELSWEDIKNNHLIFIGGGKNQKNLREILADRDFVVGSQEVRNRKPQPGEADEYRQEFDPRTGGRIADYAVITRLPGLEKGKAIMVLAASTTEGIWGAAEAVTNARTASTAVRKLRTKAGMPEAFQVVLRVKLQAGAPVESGYVTHHILAGR